MRPTVLLFDIDGTLITTGGAGRKALARAFEVRYGRGDACTFPLDGMTDRAIVRKGLAAINAPASEDEIDAILAAYVEHLDETLSEIHPSQYRVHDGMVAAVESALASPLYAVGLGTGNIKAGAKAKLDRVGLYAPFTFGGFGCDHEQRDALIRIGAERGAAKLGLPLAECRVVVIGDTPKDVAAAQALGAECVGVATGRFDVATLMSVGATAAFESLAAPGALDAVLAGRR